MDEEAPAWYPVVLRMAKSLIIPRELWEDAISEGCIAAIGATRTYDPTRGVPYDAWIGIKVRYHIRSWLARERERWPMHDDIEAEWERPTKIRHDGAEDWMDFCNLMAAIPPETAMVIGMCLYGYRAMEISKRCKVSGPQIAAIKKGFTEMAQIG
jgi:DNA-directed RNA polymerase specialized sigma24 family protein